MCCKNVICYIVTKVYCCFCSKQSLSLPVACFVCRLWLRAYNTTLVAWPWAACSSLPSATSPCWNSVQPLSHCWNPIVSWGCFSSGITRELPIPIHSCRSLTLISINLTLYLSDTALSSALLREKLTKRSPSISTFLCGSRGCSF